MLTNSDRRGLKLRKVNNSCTRFLAEPLEPRRLLSAQMFVTIGSKLQGSEFSNGTITVNSGQTVAFDVQLETSGSTAAPTGTLEIFWAEDETFRATVAFTYAGAGPTTANGPSSLYTGTGSIELLNEANPGGNQNFVYAEYEGDSVYQDTSSAPLIGTQVREEGSFVPVLFHQAQPTLVFAKQPYDIGVDTNMANPPVVVSIENYTADEQVDITVASGPGTLVGSINGMDYNNTTDGSVSFTTIALSQAGTYTLTASASGCTPVTSNPFVVGDDQLRVKVQPANGNAGEPLHNVVITAVDARGRIDTTNNTSVVTLLPVGAMAGNPVTGNSETLVAGVATFTNLSFDDPGKYQLQPELDGSASGPTTRPFTIYGDHLRIVTQPKSNVGINEPVQFVVELDDHSNKPDDSLSGTFLSLTRATARTDPGQSSLFSSIRVQLAGAQGQYDSVNGPTFSGSGSYSLKVSIPANPLTTPITTRVFRVAPDQMKFVTQPGQVMVGSAIPAAVGLFHPDGTPDPTSSFAVKLTPVTVRYEGAAKVTTIKQPGTASFVNGVAVFDSSNGPTSTGPGIYKLSALATGIKTIDSDTFQIVGDAIVVVLQPKTVAVDAPIGLTVEAKFVGGTDAGQIDTDINGDQAKIAMNTISLMPLPAGAQTSLNRRSSATFVDGVADFSGLSIGRAGTYTYTITRASLDESGNSVVDTSTIPATTKPIKVADNHLEFVGLPTTVAANAPLTFTVQVNDSSGQPNPDVNSTLVFSYEKVHVDGTIASFNSSPVPIVAGVAVITVGDGPSFSVPGTYRLIVSVSDLDSTTQALVPSSIALPLTSPVITVTPAGG